MQDFSIDLETADNRYSSAILAIGVCQFDRNTGELGKTFYREINIDSAMRHGTFSADTLCWWMGQSDEARKLFTDKTRQKHLLPRVLVELAAFIPKGSRVWGNGATHDIAILEHAYLQVAQNHPWDFWNIRDMRTAVDMADYRKDTVPFAGVAHNALDDSIHQAKVIAWCFSKALQTATKRPAEDDLV